MCSTQISEHIRIGEYQQAAEVFKSLSVPTATDKRWGGLALHLVDGNYTEIVNTLQTAIAEGCVEAHIELASVFARKGKIELAYKMLAKVHPVKDKLTPLDAAFYYRQLAALERSSGKLEQALEHIELAWYQTFLSEEAAKRSRYGIAHGMSTIYSLLGQDYLAAEYMDIAIQEANPTRKNELYLQQVITLGYIGELERAQSIIDTVETNDLPLLEVRKLDRQGFIHRNLNYLEDAKQCYEQAVIRAKEHNLTSAHVFATIYLATVYLELDNPSEARKLIAQAKIIPKSKREQMHLNFREASLASYLGDKNAEKLFQKAIAAFEEASSHEILACTYLHFAEHKLQFSETAEAESLMCKATDIRHSVGKAAIIPMEIRTLTRVLNYLDALPEEHYAKEIYYDYLEKGKIQKQPTVVTLQSLGQEEILIDGEPVRLTMNRAVEIACYLLKNPASKLESIIATVFAEDDPKRAKNYFHQSRYDLESAVPGLKVPYDVKTRSYSVVHNNYEFEWDVEKLQYSLNTAIPEDVFQMLMSYNGAFLPSSSTEWAEQERESIAWSALKVGLQMLEQWYDAGDYNKCLDLASKLRDIDPYNESLVLYILEATHKLEGDVIAQMKVTQFEKLFEEEVGEFPIQVDSLFNESKNLKVLN